MAQKRPWLAALLAFVYPGLGHLYLRKWGRALLWFVLVVATAMLVMPSSLVDAFQAGGVLAFLDAAGAVSYTTMLPLFAVRVLNATDAYWIASQMAADPESEGPSAPVCPECGRELDADLDFCHWCSTPLDAGTEAGAEQSAPRQD